MEDQNLSFNGKAATFIQTGQTYVLLRKISLSSSHQSNNKYYEVHMQSLFFGLS